MFEFLTFLFLLIIIVSNSGSTAKHHKTNKHDSNSTTTSHNMKALEPNRTYEEYTRWSSWSRCMDCFQRRMKTCISISCEGSRMYEEKPCKKKRCKRKLRQKDEFHVVRLTENSSYLTKQGPSEIWSKWSSWSPCTHNCRTYRYRKCKKPGRCSKQILKEEAYCYHERSNCEVYVLNLMETNRSYDAKRYQYNNNNSDTAFRQPRKKVDTVKRCGIPHKKSKMLRIIGGSESKKYKWPWHVAILNQHMEVICGGTLIAPRWILTANHCIRKYLRVRLNAHDLRARDGSDLEMSVHKMFPHPKFDYKTVDNDIALLMLPRSVRTPVACLPNKRPKSRQLCSVMGWGKVDPSDFFGIPVLHEAKLPIVTADTCRKSNKQLYISENMLCAGWASGIADTCAGDSGGGLMCPTKRYKKTIYSVQGITSFGDGCGMKNKYGIYTTVFNYVGWINYIIDHYS